MLANPNDRDVLAKAQLLRREATEMMMKAARGGRIAPNPIPFPQPFPELGRVPAIDRGRLGVRMERVPAIAADQLGLEPNVGIAINFVTPGSPAEKAGLKVNDIILEFAGKPVSDNTEEFARRVTDVKANEKVDLVVLRKGKKVDVKGVQLPDVPRREVPRPAPFAFPELPQLNPLPIPNPVAVPDGFDSVSYTSTGDSFALKAKKGALTFALSGALNADGTAVLKKAVIEGDGVMHTSDQIDKLPAEFQRDAAQLLKTVKP